MTIEKDPEQNEIKYLHKFVDLKGARVLEVGCGEGRLTWRYAAGPDFTVGIDPEQDSLRVAVVDRPSDLEERIHFSNAMAEELPFPGESFDVVLLSWSF